MFLQLFPTRKTCFLCYFSKNPIPQRKLRRKKNLLEMTTNFLLSSRFFPVSIGYPKVQTLLTAVYSLFCIFLVFYPLAVECHFTRDFKNWRTHPSTYETVFTQIEHINYQTEQIHTTTKEKKNFNDYSTGKIFKAYQSGTNTEREDWNCLAGECTDQS